MLTDEEIIELIKKLKEESNTNKPTPNNQPEGKPPVSRRLFSETK